MNKNFLLGKIKYVEGDAARPRTSDYRIIVLFNNNKGEYDTENYHKRVDAIYNKGTVGGYSPKSEYRRWYRGQHGFKLGATHVTAVQSDTEIAHLVVKKAEVTENSNGSKDVVEELDLDATETALKELGRHCVINKLNAHFDKCSFWDYIEPLVEKHLLQQGVNVTVYEYVK